MSVELLAPGGDPLAVKAAILAGADAVFLGVGDFNARKRAVNITTKDLEELCSIAHVNDCRIYLTFNTLALETEFATLVQLLHKTIEAGIDAVILQDYGLLNVIHRLFPQLEIHASTQMTTHNEGQIDFLKPYGVQQVNFSRELALSEIQTLTAACHDRDVLVEVFVHGAFCVSFSGQCYMSNNLYEHTANRGACVQPCRRNYTTEPSRKGIPTIQPLNLKDNSAFSSAKELIDAGVDSLKIEGRIKGYEYVFSTVESWREQVNRIVQEGHQNSKDKRLTAVFNRSFSDTLLQGAISKDAFTKESGDESLEEIATVWNYHADKKELSVKRGSTLPVGKKITIRTSNGKFICTGTVKKQIQGERYTFAIEHLLKGKIEKGQTILAQPQLTDTEKLQIRLENLTANESKLPLSLTVLGTAENPLILTAQGNGKKITVSSEIDLERASNRPVEHSTVKERLGKLGNTPFYLAACDLSELAEDLFIPMKLLNELRREAVEQLVPDEIPVPTLPVIKTADQTDNPTMAVVVQDEKLLEQIPVDSTVLFQVPADEKRITKVSELFKDRNLIPWFPPILIEEQFSAAKQFLEDLKPEWIVTENTGIAAYAESLQIDWIAGPLLNASNGYAFELFQQRGAIGGFPEYEITNKQLNDISIPESFNLWLPIVTPVLYMNSRHCLVRNCNDCGKEVMDEWCLPNCNRSARIYDKENAEIFVVKKAGHYNGIYSNGLRVNESFLKSPKGSTFLLDLRVPDNALLPKGDLCDFLENVENAISSNTTEMKQVLKAIPKVDTTVQAGLEPLLACD